MTTTTSSSIRLTKADYFTAISAMMDGASTYVVTKGEKFAEITIDMVKEFCVNERELLDRKNSNKKPTEKQTANEEIKSAILSHLADGNAYTVSALMKSVPACAELSNQRVAALVRQLVDDGKVTREEVKRVAYFKLA